MQATWSPIIGLKNVIAHLTDWQSSAHTYNPVCPSLSCTGPGGYTNPRVAPQLLGDRTLFAIVDQGDAAAFRFPTAQLPNAYPLTEVQYAMVPTCGVGQAKARAISTFLKDVAASQLHGTVPGELPAFGCYLTLNANQKAQDLTAAHAVLTQPCTSPTPDQTVSGSLVSAD